MAERYQLSQDFQERQLQLLERKYGGAGPSAAAALTIQRAFRRYSMAKKFADLTAQAKKEPRVGRRALDGASPGSPSPGGGAAGKRGAHSRAPPNGSLIYASPPVGGGQRHRCHVHHHHHYHHHSGRHHHAGFSPSSSSSSTAAIALAPSLSTEEEPKASLPHPASTSSLEAEGSSDTAAAGSSCPDIQSFPLDETSVYSYQNLRSHHNSSRSSSSHRGSVKSNGSGGATAASHPVLNASSDVADGSSPRSKKSTGASPLSSAPSVPKRTVSHLSEGSSSSSSSRSKIHQQSSSPASFQSQQHYARHHNVLSPSSSSSTGARRTQQPQSFGDGGEVRLRHPQHQHQVQSSPALLHAQQQQLVRGSPGGGDYSAGEVLRKRHYRTGLNIFNKRPEKGVAYLIRRGFLENSPQAVARFLITRKGLSKQMIGEYLGNLSHPFNGAVLSCFALELDLGGMQVDTALRKFQTYFRMPGEAQKIERLMEVFSGRYCECNADAVGKFHSNDTVFILAFAIILLNTDLHTPSLKQEKRMKVEDFIRNLRGIDDGHDVDTDLLMGIYDRVRNQEFKPGGDHVTQVMKVQQTIVSKCPNLAVPHRRLVCYCRLYEVPDPHKRERPGVHQREVFLFNDILVITKIHSRKKSSVTYAFRQSHLLAGLQVTLFDTQFYPFGIQISDKYLGKVVLRLNARNDHDRSKFVEDLRESVAEMDEMEALRLEAELEKQSRSSITSVPTSPAALSATASASPAAAAANVSNGDAKRAGGGEHHGGGRAKHANGGLAMRQQIEPNGGAGGGSVVLRRSAINNSLLDLSEAAAASAAEKAARRGSVGSLDSGMSVSFQSTSVGSFQQQQAAAVAAAAAETKSPRAAAAAVGAAVRHH